MRKDQYSCCSSAPLTSCCSCVGFLGGGIGEESRSCCHLVLRGIGGPRDRIEGVGFGQVLTRRSHRHSSSCCWKNARQPGNKQCCTPTNQKNDERDHGKQPPPPGQLPSPSH